MISANGGLPVHRYTPQVTPEWPRGSEPASAPDVHPLVSLCHAGNPPLLASSPPPPGPPCPRAPPLPHASPPPLTDHLFAALTSRAHQARSNAAMLHLVRDCLFQCDSPLHHEFSGSLETFIAEHIASGETEWFPCISGDLHSLTQKVVEVQGKSVELEQRVDGLQISVAIATAATDHRVHALQALTGTPHEQQ